MTSQAGRGDEGTVWRIGTEITSSGEGIRSFMDPSIFGDPDTYGGGNWDVFAGVHTNSSVQNHWFYLLATGEQGNNEFGEAYDIEALGRDTAFAIAYRNLTVYLTESSDYEDAAFYSLLAAQDLYGSCSNAYLATNEAWRAVGLGQVFPAEFSALFSAPQSHCEVPAVVTFSNFSSPFSSVSWDFGDGATSTESSPTHTYISSGSFNVSLAIEGCDGERDTLLLEDYIIIDPENPVCDTTVMVSSQTIVLNSCEGVITDPGGADGMHGDNQSAFVLINPPSGGSVILDFSEFSLENTYDFLYLYDGDSRDAPLIGAYSGTFLLGQTIESTGSSIFLHFESDGSIVRDGFVCSFRSSGGNIPAQAAFSVSNNTPAYNEPVTFSTTFATSGTVDFYDFGDGTSAFGANQATHQYQNAGTYTVTQYVSTCIDRDTITGIITVSEPGTITVNPDSICVTMLSNDSLEQLVTITNAGPGPLYYSASLDNDDYDFFSEKPFLNQNFTTHDLTFPSDAEVINISFTLNGNFDGVFEGVDIFLNNRFYRSLGYDEESAPNGTDITQSFVLTGNDLAVYTANGSVSITIENDFRVANTNAGQSIHRVSLSYPGSELVNLEGTRAGTVANGDSAVLPVMLRSTGLLGGTYTSLLLLETGDPDRPVIEIPVKVLVIGQPELMATPTDITFGETYIGFPNSAEVTLTNPGTDDLLISAISLSDEVNYSLSVGNQEMVIPPGQSEQFTVMHDPFSAASHPAQLTISSNVPDEVVNITGLGIAPANVNFSPDTICFLIENGAEVTQQFFFSNTGTGVLTWRISSPGGTPVPFTFSSGSGTTAPEQAETVDVTIDGNSLAVGTFYYDMPFLSNIPERESINVPIKVIVRTAPVAIISPLQDSYCDNDVQFTDGSTASPTSWVWDFGDGSSSADQSPAHRYTASGAYTVTLEVCNDLGCTSTESSVLITLGADFCTEIIMEDNQTQSVSSCTGTIYDDGGPEGSYSDGINSTLTINPVGAESIELEVISFLTENCCDFLNVYQGDPEDNVLIGNYRGSDLTPGSIISVPGEKTTIQFVTDGSVVRSGFEILWRCVRSEPIPSFTMIASEDCSNRIQFNNTSTNTTSHLWNFGDGTTSTEVNPVHDFGNLGAFDVTLMASNESFRDSLTQTVAVGGLPFDLELDFPETVMIDEVVDFGTVSNVELSSHRWSLGIGSPISLASPQFVYTEAGTYTISLQVLGPDGCGMTKSRNLRVDFRTDVRQSSAGINYKLYPNPTNGLAALEVDLPGGPAPTNLRLVDALGRTVLEQPVLADNTTIDTRGLAAGVYWVQVFREGSLLLTDRLLVRR